MTLSFAPSSDLGRLLAAQYGVVGRRQIIGLGATDRQLEHMLAFGYLRPTGFRAVYSAGQEPATKDARHLAAVLACGEDAALSHVSAAAHWGLCDLPATIHVTNPDRACRRLTGIRLHESHLDPMDRVVDRRIPVTTVARTLLDVGAIGGPRWLARAYASADRLGLIRHDELRALVHRSWGRRGVAILREHHARCDPAARPTRSELEHLALDLFTGSGIPPSRTNVVINGREVDMVWDDERVMVELDGYRYHAGDVRFNSDRSRDLELSASGYQVVRVTWEMLRDRPEAVVYQLRQILANRRRAMAI